MLIFQFVRCLFNWTIVWKKKTPSLPLYSSPSFSSSAFNKAPSLTRRVKDNDSSPLISVHLECTLLNWIILVAWRPTTSFAALKFLNKRELIERQYKIAYYKFVYSVVRGRTTAQNQLICCSWGGGGCDPYCPPPPFIATRKPHSGAWPRLELCGTSIITNRSPPPPPHCHQ